jgi:hypothetical protein
MKAFCRQLLTDELLAVAMSPQSIPTERGLQGWSLVVQISAVYHFLNGASLARLRPLGCSVKNTREQEAQYRCHIRGLLSLGLCFVSACMQLLLRRFSRIDKLSMKAYLSAKTN